MGRFQRVITVFNQILARTPWVYVKEVPLLVLTLNFANSDFFLTFEKIIPKPTKMTRFFSRALVCVCALIMACVAAEAQTMTERLSTAKTPFTMPLDEVLGEVEALFGVVADCRNFDPSTRTLDFAPSRIRPYSLEETLDNVLKPLDLKWEKNGKRVRIQPYEYHRRQPADGEKLLAWLSAKYQNTAEWEVRAEEVKREALTILNLDPFVRGLAADPDIRMGEVVKHAGYTTQNFALETLPGLYTCGTIYAPAAKTKGKRPLIISPAGHWPEARYRADQQYRMATFARMGAVAVDMDIVAWGESEHQLGIAAHQADYAMQVQVLWSKVVTDWILATRKDVDVERMAATGGSGGGTHTLMLALVDGRFSVLAPVVHLVSHFDGGCPCESGRPVTLAAGGSAMPELLAAVMAPKPVITVSDGGDWTRTYPELEQPYLHRIWGFYNAQHNLRNAHFEAERHDYGVNKRMAVYRFFADHLGLDLQQVDETQVELQPHEALQTFRGDLPEGAIRSASELETLIKNLK